MASKPQLFLMAAAALAAGPLSGVPLVLAQEGDSDAVQPRELTPPPPVVPEPQPASPAVTAAPAAAESQLWRLDAADRPPATPRRIDASVDDLVKDGLIRPSERLRVRGNLITPQVAGPRERACLDGVLSQDECGGRVVVVGRSRRDGLSFGASVVSGGAAALTQGEGPASPPVKDNANDAAPSEGQAQPEPAQRQPLVHAKQASRRHASPGGFWISGALALPVYVTAAVFPALGIVMELGILALPDQLRRPTDRQVERRKMAARLPQLPLRIGQVRWAPLDLKLKVCRSVPVCPLVLALATLQDRQGELWPTGLRASGLPSR